jgi:hypothetical protein
MHVQVLLRPIQPWLLMSWARRDGKASLWGFLPERADTGDDEEDDKMKYAYADNLLAEPANFVVIRNVVEEWMQRLKVSHINEAIQEQQARMQKVLDQVSKEGWKSGTKRHQDAELATLHHLTLQQYVMQRHGLMKQIDISSIKFPVLYHKACRPLRM